MMSDIIQAIKIEMREQAVTAYRLAQLSGVSRVTIKGVLDGKNSPTLDTIQKILKPLGLQLIIKKENVK